MDFIWSNIYFRIIGIPLIYMFFNLLLAYLGRSGPEKLNHNDFRNVGLSMGVAALGINAAFWISQKTIQINGTSSVSSDTLFQRFYELMLVIVLVMLALAAANRAWTSARLTVASVLIGASTVIIVFYSWSPG